MNTSVTTNFNYDDATMTMQTIETLTDELNNILNQMNGIVEDNINNPNVWKGESATSFKAKWDEFAKDFPNFVNDMKKQSANIKTALDNYHNWEQSNQ